MLFFFEPRWRESDQFGNERIGVYRAQFILETLQRTKAGNTISRWRANGA